MSKIGLLKAMTAYKNRLPTVFHFEDIDKPFDIELRIEPEEMIKILNKHFPTDSKAKMTKRKLMKVLRQLGKL